MLYDSIHIRRAHVAIRQVEMKPVVTEGSHDPKTNCWRVCIHGAYIESVFRSRWIST